MLVHSFQLLCWYLMCRIYCLILKSPSKIPEFLWWRCCLMMAATLHSCHLMSVGIYDACNVMMGGMVFCGPYAKPVICCWYLCTLCQAIIMCLGMTCNCHDPINGPCRCTYKCCSLSAQRSWIKFLLDQQFFYCSKLSIIPNVYLFWKTKSG